MSLTLEQISLVQFNFQDDTETKFIPLVIAPVVSLGVY